MRLIDADALMDVIRQHEYRLATKQGSIDYGMFTLGIQQAVDEQQTIDAVPVVRCRECKYHYWEQEPCHGKIVHYCKLPHMRGVEVFKEFFCYYGERKEGADNEP